MVRSMHDRFVEDADALFAEYGARGVVFTRGGRTSPGTPPRPGSPALFRDALVAATALVHGMTPREPRYGSWRVASRPILIVSLAARSL